MGPVETEIKLRMDGGAPVAADLLERHGYRIRFPRVLQIDQVFDLPEGALRRSRRLLRVRSSGGVSTITYKGPPFPGRHKSREEIEASLAGQTGTFEMILNRLGYVPSFLYEKYRTTYFKEGDGLANAIIALDETPIGVFLELEGPADWIDRTASTLGFGVSDYIKRSYATLYAEYVRTHGGLPDMKFT